MTLIPLCLVNRPSTSSSAFFNDAAAKMVIDFSCATAAGGKPGTTMAAAKAARTRLLSNTMVLQKHGFSSFAQKKPRTHKNGRLGEPSFQAYTASAQQAAFGCIQISSHPMPWQNSSDWLSSARQGGVTFLRIAAPGVLFEHDLSENQSPLFGIMLQGSQGWRSRSRLKSSTTTSSSERARLAACWLTGFPPTPTSGCSCSRRADTTIGYGFIYRLVTYSPLAIRVRIGVSRPKPKRDSTA